MSAKEHFNVAIVGGGMGGATAAHYLREMFGSGVSIHLFEKTDHIGGRIKSVTFAGHLREVGASMFHSSNRYMYDFSKQLGLDLVNWSKNDFRITLFGPKYQPLFSNVETYSFLDPIYVLRHFGPGFIYARLKTMTFVTRFRKIYELQDNGHCYTTPSMMFQSLSPDFIEMTKLTFQDWLRKEITTSANFINQFAYGLLSNTYNQNVNVHGFVGLIALASTLPTIYSVFQGNAQVPKGLIENCLKSNPLPTDPKAFIQAEVTKISKSSNSDRYCLTYRDEQSGKLTSVEFDYVVLASPQHQNSQLILPDDVKLTKTQYQKVDSSLFHGLLKPGAFGIKPDLQYQLPNLIMLPTESYYKEEQGVKINTLCTEPKYTSSKSTMFDHVYSSFSDPDHMSEPLKSIPDLFVDLEKSDESTYTQAWLAYPVFKPLTNPETELGSFVLAPKLFYINCIEKMASCMEIAAIGGRNVALLIGADRQKSGSSYKFQLNTSIFQSNVRWIIKNWSRDGAIKVDCIDS